MLNPMILQNFFTLKHLRKMKITTRTMNQMMNLPPSRQINHWSVKSVSRHSSRGLAGKTTRLSTKNIGPKSLHVTSVTKVSSGIRIVGDISKTFMEKKIMTQRRVEGLQTS